MRLLRNLMCRNKSLYKHVNLAPVRTLFTQDSLGVMAYVGSRELELGFTTKPEEFKNEFLKKLEHSPPLHVLQENLKRFVHVCNNESHDLSLLWRALRMYRTKCDQLRRQSKLDEKKLYAFGPTTMRLLHHFNQPEYAIKFFDDGNIKELFDQLTTYQVLLDLLYDNREYGELLRIYTEIEKRILDRNLYVPSTINAIIFATYYRVNTPVHDELAYDMYKRLKECGRHTEQYRKSIALVAAMRLRRKQPNDSLEILSIHDDTDVNIRYIRILAHSYLQQFDDVLRLLKMTISSNKTILIPDQLLQKIEGKMKRLPDGNKITEEYKLIYNELKELNLIFYKKLDDVLCARFPTNMAPYKPTKMPGQIF